MRTKWVFVIALMLGLAAMPAMARHRHHRGCGHVYSRARHGWVSINVATRNFGFSYTHAPRSRGRYSGPYGYWDPYRYDSRYDRRRGYWKKHRGHRHGYKDRCRY